MHHHSLMKNGLFLAEEESRPVKMHGTWRTTLVFKIGAESVS